MYVFIYYIYIYIYIYLYILFIYLVSIYLLFIYYIYGLYLIYINIYIIYIFIYYLFIYIFKKQSIESIRRVVASRTSPPWSRWSLVASHDGRHHAITNDTVMEAMTPPFPLQSPTTMKQRKIGLKFIANIERCIHYLFIV